MAFTDLSASGTLYIKDTPTGIKYSTDKIGYLSVLFPVNIINTNPAVTLKVIFETDITLYNNLEFFKCGSSNIQFGSETLSNTGNRTVITITENIIGYPGFISNGYVNNSGVIQEDGFSNIYIYNIDVNVDSKATGGGYSAWVTQGGFGANASDCYIINCTTNGYSPSYGGGICGAYTGNVTIIGCSSSGLITPDSCGGICGAFCGSLGPVTILRCYTSGDIGGESAGGICGPDCGTGNSVTITKCYSIGSIYGNNSGGICGNNVGTGASVSITNCYSRGSISNSSGGIVGGNAGSNGVSVSITNCYSSGDISSNSGGIVGQPSSTCSVNISHCYTCGSSSSGSGIVTGYLYDNINDTSTGVLATNCYSEANNSSSGWKDSNTNVLQYVQTGLIPGSSWYSTRVNYPFLISNFLYSPYTQNIISSNLLVTSVSSTDTALLSWVGIPKSLAIQTTQPSISLTIDSLTGILSLDSPSTTQNGLYDVYVKYEKDGDFLVTRYTLTVTTGSSGGGGGGGGGSSTRNPLTDILGRSIGVSPSLFSDIKAASAVVSCSLTRPPKFNSFDGYLKYVKGSHNL